VVPLVSRVETTFLHDGTIGALVRSDVVDVVERTRIDAIGAEVGLTKGGYTDPAKAAQLGKLLGASHVLVGTVAEVQLRREPRPLPYTTRTEEALRGRIRVQYRIVEVESGRVVGADSADVRDDAGHTQGRDDAQAFWEHLQATASDVLALRVLDVVAPLRVVTIENSRAELSRGTSSGIATGLVCDVLDARQDTVAHIVVSHASATHASGEVDGDPLAVGPGMACRPQAAPPPAPPAARSDPTAERW
jgi:TolB-like protein